MYKVTIPIWLLVGLFTLKSQAQEKRTVINYFASFGDDVLNELDTYVPTTIREKENFTRAKKHLNQKFTDRVFTKLTEELAKKSMAIEPIEALKDFKIIYNDLGYPIPLVVKGAIKKAKKNGYQGNYYYSINAYCSDIAGLASASKLAKQSKPQVKITINVFDENGSKITKAEGKVKRSKPIKAKEFNGKFDKLECDSMDALLVMVNPLVDEAVAKAISNL